MKQKEKCFFNKKTLNGWLAVLVIINLYSQFFQNSTGIHSFVFVLIPLLAIAICSFSNRRILLPRKIMIISLPMIIVPIFQMVWLGLNIKNTKYIVYILLFLILIPVVDKGTWEEIKKCCYVIGCALNFDVLLNLPRILKSSLRIYNIRNFLIVDKPFYSLFLTITVIFGLLDILYKETKSRLLTIIYIVISLLVNIVVIQSKISIAILFMAIMVFIMSGENKKRKKVLLVCVSLLGFFSVAIVLYPSIVPYYVRYAFQYLFGTRITNADQFSRYAFTFVQRKAIYRFGINLFASNPISGIGFGHYSYYADATVLFGNTTEIESSLLGCFVEGGVLYGVSYVGLNIYLGLQFVKHKELFKQSRTHMELFIILTIYFVFCIQNDYINVFYWVVMAVCAGYITNIRRFEKMDQDLFLCEKTN